MNVRAPSRRQRLLALARPRHPETLPQRLDRRRIYVLPTPFGLFVAALLAAMLLGALNYNNNPALLLALLLAGTGVASMISAHLALSGLSLEAVSAEPVAAGQLLRLRLAISQRDQRHRPGLQLDHANARSWTSLPAGGHSDATLDLPTTQRGWLDLERIRISTTQPLGLVRAWAWFWPEQPLLVYPKSESQGPGLPEQGSDPLHSRMDPAGEELHQLRPYRAGDPRRSIAWKHSARRDSLLVREYEKPVGIEIVLDWHQLAGLGNEARIARLARWVDLAERQGRRYSLKLPGQPMQGPGIGAAHHHLCLRALALLPHD
ncbi:DUF58 domain-containing protein [Stenotrophomonas tumulicola]|nr:DUF58 domain-containing protein [Stenotrophomonas tumulicola]